MTIRDNTAAEYFGPAASRAQRVTAARAVHAAVTRLADAITDAESLDLEVDLQHVRAPRNGMPQTTRSVAAQIGFPKFPVRKPERSVSTGGNPQAGRNRPMNGRDFKSLCGVIANLQRAKAKLFALRESDETDEVLVAAFDVQKVVERLIALAVAAAPVGAMSAYPDKVATSEAPLVPRPWTPLDDEDWTGSNLMGG